MFNVFFFLKKVELLLQFLGNFQVLISSPTCNFHNYFVINEEIGKRGTRDGLQFPNSI